MVVMGFFLGIGISLLKPLIKQQKVSQTRNIILSARFAILGYAISSKDLPDTLNQAGARSIDAFGKQIYYIKANISDLCNDTSTGLSIKDDCPDPSCSGVVEIKDIAVILVSGGRNQNVQTRIINNGVVNIYKPHVQVDDYAGDVSRIEEYDDIVEYISLAELKGRICSP